MWQPCAHPCTLHINVVSIFVFVLAACHHCVTCVVFMWQCVCCACVLFDMYLTDKHNIHDCIRRLHAFGQCLLLIACWLLPSACCLLPIAYRPSFFTYCHPTNPSIASCILPIVFCLSPIAYCVLAIAYCLMCERSGFCRCVSGDIWESLPSSINHKHAHRKTKWVAYRMLHIAYCILHIYNSTYTNIC